jgi:hypothetical protein
MRADPWGQIVFRMPLVAIFLLSFVLANPSQAATIFRNQADWLAAAGGTMTTDDFSTDKSALSFTLDSGVVSSISSISAGEAHYISGGVFWLQVNPTFVTWVFPSPVAAFAFQYDSVNGNTKVVGNFDGTGDQTITIRLDLHSGFFGLIGAAKFTTIVFENISGADTFRVTNLSFGGEPLATSEVPLPAALPLFATGLGAIGLMGWRRKRKAAAAA